MPKACVHPKRNLFVPLSVTCTTGSDDETSDAQFHYHDEPGSSHHLPDHAFDNNEITLVRATFTKLSCLINLALQHEVLVVSHQEKFIWIIDPTDRRLECANYKAWIPDVTDNGLVQQKSSLDLELLPFPHHFDYIHFTSDFEDGHTSQPKSSKRTIPSRRVHLAWKKGVKRQRNASKW
uniref:AlNc14C671G12380 protein n=1 Tax=Albugo laibachii Nc14 TaxID=890382 RepID=F0X1R3_9STRA|nr:AlNc14C671G12380 [Albugo laibachii Nc14]|eukprot:CCA27765.1 AlNc14C671G12380 [Albugo laibachii Nc14]